MALASYKAVILIIVAVLGVGVLGSYVPVVQAVRKGTDLWFGMNKGTKAYFYTCICLAVIGFIVWLLNLMIDPIPEEGLFRNQAVLPLLIVALLVSALLWSIFVVQTTETESLKSKKTYAVLTSLSLVVTAVCSILLAAGTIEANSKWYAVAGISVFCLTTVVNDSVIWNANFLRQVMYDV